MYPYINERWLSADWPNNMYTAYGKVNTVGVSFPLFASCLLPAEFWLPLIPSRAATLPQPVHPNKLFAAISPNPSITPLINGSTKLIARLLARASNLARLDRLESNIDSVTEGGAMGGNANVAAPALRVACEEDMSAPVCVCEGWPIAVDGSVGGKLIDGYEDAKEPLGTFSQPWEVSSPEPCPDAVPFAVFGFAAGERTCYD